ncbi:MAG: hypothetical protein WAO02_11030, partial [Verrucomicrobiia bacterium]
AGAAVATGAAGAAGAAASAVAAAAGADVVLLLSLPDWQPASRTTAATEINETNDTGIKRFAFCINFLWFYDLSHFEFQQKCCDAWQMQSKKSWILLQCPGGVGQTKPPSRMKKAEKLLPWAAGPAQAM